MDAHKCNLPNAARLDQAARDVSPALAALYKGLIANGLKREEAAAVVVGCIMYKTPEEDE